MKPAAGHQLSLTFAFLLSFLVGHHPCTAHPLQAEPINHPYVFTFDQFNVPEDPDEHLISGGLLLLAELRCAACHAAPDQWAERIKPAPGPDLSGVGSRLDQDTLWLLVRSPQHRKRGTLMPGLFANAEGDEEKVEAIVSYLASLKKDITPLPTGDAMHGKQLYHTVGCVACHEPALDARPPGIEAGTDFERPGNASIPIALADAYDIHALGRMLLDPMETRPAGRMPSHHLSEQEAADLAAYLHEGRAVEKAPERAALGVPAQTAASGKALFQTLRCAHCHDTGDSAPADRKMSLPISQLQLTTATNCLTESPAPGAARYGLNALQLRAISLALKLVQTAPPPPLTAHEQIDWQMTRLNCYSCHDRDGKGGPEDPRVAFFINPNTAKDELLTLSRFPVALDGTGSRLTEAMLQDVLITRTPLTQPHLSVRMPSFGQANVQGLIQYFREADKVSPPLQK